VVGQKHGLFCGIVFGRHIRGMPWFMHTSEYNAKKETRFMITKLQQRQHDMNHEKISLTNSLDTIRVNPVPGDSSMAPCAVRRAAEYGGTGGAGSP
jgi:hypothetical protein